MGLKMTKKLLLIVLLLLVPHYGFAVSSVFDIKVSAKTFVVFGAFYGVLQYFVCHRNDQAECPEKDNQVMSDKKKEVTSFKRFW